MTAFDPRTLRDAFGAFATGVTVVTSRTGDGSPIGFTANSFASVSLDPPLLLICLAKTSRNFANMTGAKAFAVNVLAENQKDVSNTFAKPVEDRFAAVKWQDGPAGSPVFPGAAAWFDCTSEEIVDAGDHAILIGRVAGFENSGRNGLGYVRGGYFTPSLEAKAARASVDEDTNVSAVVERAGEILLVPADGDRFALPSTTLGDRDPMDAIEADLLSRTGIQTTAGYLFSVFEDRAGSRQNIVYRTGAAEGAPRAGQFVAISDIPFDRLDTPQTADILRRFISEQALGNYGVYFGNETAGRVHAFAGKA
ncbi:flavin reductase family protein [Aureimonas psammosilenae]|uniref:flavin reductase family protein n=1 Tax=Aureimonas psammosilenae TaxID=2495496 RepID=UPI001260E75C|nr:flavin reductase family protein [Aureimonas psammosilenae]